MRAALIAAVVAGAPAPALAHYACGLSASGSGLAIVCVGTPDACFYDEECTEPEHVCDALSATESRCRPRCSTLFTCASPGDGTVYDYRVECPKLGDLEPTGCEVVAPALGMTPGQRLCLYEGIPYCRAVGEVGLARFRACHQRPEWAGGDVTPNWFEGDCDDDECPNAFDAMPCSPDGASDCTLTPAMETGPGCEARWPAFDDAGTPGADAGSALDAGPADGDAGPKPDAGAGAEPDAGAMDAGRAAGGPPPRFVGSGCAISGRPGSWLAVALALAALARRRR